MILSTSRVEPSMLTMATAETQQRESDEAERSVPEVSVVVTARNASGCLPLLLEMLDQQTLDPQRWELVLVDDQSTDGTAEIAEAHPRAVVIRAREHVGLPRGRNIGIAGSRAGIIAFTDADCVPDRDWLERGLARMPKGTDILAGGITIPAADDATIAALVDSATYLDQERYTKRGFGAGANLWVRRDVFERVGGFNELLEAYGGDEEELCQRAIRNDATFVYAPEVHVLHPPRVRMRELTRKAFKLGFGLAAHRRYNEGPLGNHPRIFLQWRSYAPSRRIYNIERVRAQRSRSLRRREILGMYIVQHICVQIPVTMGDLLGEVHQARLRRRERAATSGAAPKTPGL
jgi:glycosyltransferase involved in cell wall biosynthesis